MISRSEKGDPLSRLTSAHKNCNLGAYLAPRLLVMDYIDEALEDYRREHPRYNTRTWSGRSRFAAEDWSRAPRWWRRLAERFGAEIPTPRTPSDR